MRALLEPLRGVADEIVVAADSRVDPAELAEHAAVADRLIRFERKTPNAALAWLHEQCRGDWVLTIAGDEVASTALIDALPELTGSRRALQVWLPMRWTFPDPRRWLHAWPWFPDFHNRLVRNDGTLRFPGAKHTHAAQALPARWVEPPLYHLDLVLLSTEERRSKVERYEAQTPGLALPGGAPLNETYYLPELRSGLSPERVPPEDVELLEAVLRAEPGDALAPEVPRVTSVAELGGAWEGRAFAESGYRARLEWFEPSRALHLRPGESRAVHVRVANLGTERWSWGLEASPAIRLGYRVTPVGGGEVWEGPRSPMPHELWPGEDCIVPVVVQAPERRGEYRAEIGLVHDPVRWFGSTLEAELTVE